MTVAGARAGFARVPAVLRSVFRRWQSSLTIRIAATTLVLSGAAAVLVGATILHQVENGLMSSGERTALNQFDDGLQQAQTQFAGAEHGLSAEKRTALTTVTLLAARGTQQESYGVLLVPTEPGEQTFVSPSDYASGVPSGVRDVVTSQSREAWQLTALRRPGRAPIPSVVVGGPVAASTYDLYYVFPLSQQAQTLALVRRTVTLSGLALVALIIAIVVIVTRQVVRPVRAAASIAERLASGRHRERMPVRGHDELASLGTSFNRMAEQVQQQISQLRELSRVQQRFVADVSHELRTPITTVRMAADVLHDARGELSPELARTAELLQAQIDRFETLLADLLEISRHDAGAVTLEAEPADLGSVLRSVAEAAGPLAERRGSHIELMTPDRPVIVEIDPRRIGRVLRNLVSNAIEHGAGEPVTVRLATGPGSVAIIVRDLGPGLRPGQASLVFGRFWRADPARARSTGGTGLGLSIALEDARLHGGWLQAWGEPGRGSVFRLTLPWRVGEVITASPLPLEPDDAAEPIGVDQ